MLNRIILMGRLTANPELKSTTTGKSVTSFSIAVERNYNKIGEGRKVDFFNIVCWNSTAEFVCHYFAKGNMIALEGKLQSRTYQANDGSTRYVTEVVTDTVYFTGERIDKDNKNADTVHLAPPTTYQQPPLPLQPEYENVPLDDDLPF